ncbi:MAG: DNA repair protein RecO [Defluviitaleaceae bacterium]|nr:DNA repair protein RecO [Defluviitaleaceae bacterium]
MATIKDKGLILREYDAGESNKRLILLLEERGKVAVFARGAKGAKTKLNPPKMAFCEFVMYDGGQFLSLTQASPIRHFPALPSCYDSFCVANFLLELTDKIILPGMDAKSAMRLLLLALARLDAGRNPKLIFAAFIFKILQTEGIAPIITHCAACKAQLANSCSFGAEGLLCENCQIVPSASLCGTAIKALEYILTAEIIKTFSFKIPPDSATNLAAAATLFLQSNIDIEFKSLKFLEGT